METPRETRSYVSTEEHLHSSAVASYRLRNPAPARALDCVLLSILCVVVALTAAMGLVLLELPWWPALVLVGGAPWVCRWHVERAVSHIERQHAAQSPPGDGYTVEWGDDEWEISGKRGLSRLSYDAHSGAVEFEGFVFIRTAGKAVFLSMPRSVVPDWALAKLQGRAD